MIMIMDIIMAMIFIMMMMTILMTMIIMTDNINNIDDDDYNDCITDDGFADNGDGYGDVSDEKEADS